MKKESRKSIASRTNHDENREDSEGGQTSEETGTGRDTPGKPEEDTNIAIILKNLIQIESRECGSSGVYRSLSEPIQHHRYLSETAAVKDEQQQPEVKVDAQNPTSKISLRLKSKTTNLTDPSNIIVTTTTDPNPNVVDKDVNPQITVLYSDHFHCNSSESLITKKSFNQTLTGAATSSVVTIQPPASPKPPSYTGVQFTAVRPMVLYSAPPIHGAPPTYSALMRLGPLSSPALLSQRDIHLQPSPPFIGPPPPPSYAQAQGYCIPSVLQFADAQETGWGVEPTTTICPYCNNFILTSTHVRRSNLTHYSALALCICGCWPCCLLPYCMKSCKCVQHECPICDHVVGVFNPWQMN